MQKEDLKAKDIDIRWSKDVVRSANIQILRKVWLTYFKKKNTNGFYELLGISDSTVDKMVSKDLYFPKEWDYISVAQKIRIDEKVFNGEYLIEIKGEFYRELTEDWDSILEKIFTSRIKKDKAERKKHVAQNEYVLWKTIIENKKQKEDVNYWKMTHTKLLQDVAEQVKQEDFNDLQLWRFWNFIRKI